HGAMVLATCRRVLHHQQDAEDAFQAAFLVLVRKAGSIRKGQSVGGWLFQVAHRLALRARASGWRRYTVPRSQAASASVCSKPPSQPCASALQEEVECLPEQYRSAVVLCYVEGQTQAEAARQLGTSVDAVNSRLRRAREILRQRLTRRGWQVP